MSNDMNQVIKGISAIGAVLLVAALAACGGGGSLVSSSSSSSNSGSKGGGSNNTPPGIPNSIVFTPSSGTSTSAVTVIALQGTGGKTNADVTFQVVDASNTGVSGVPVTFALVPSTGDATLTTATGTTDANGKVSTFVVSGNEHYSVTVQATINTPSGVKTIPSNSLAITTGIPTEGNFAMSAAVLTVPNAADHLGISDEITVQLSDRFNNPAPDGTAVSFVTNSGQIQGQCLTAKGSCNVNWTSSGLPNASDGLHLPGRAEILAYTVGEETFDDADGDGVFDHSDGFIKFISGTSVDSFIEPLYPATNDIGEVYLDGAETGQYISGDFFHDFNNDGLRNPPDGKFYGFNCKGTATVSCGSTASKEIGKQLCIELATSGAAIGFGASSGLTINPDGSGTLSVGTGTNLTFTLSDGNGQALGVGTTVNLVQTSVNGFNINIPANLPFTYPDSGCGANVQSFTVNITKVSPAPTNPLSGQLVLQVITTGFGGKTTNSKTITLVP